MKPSSAVRPKRALRRERGQTSRGALVGLVVLAVVAVGLSGFALFSSGDSSDDGSVVAESPALSTAGSEDASSEPTEVDSGANGSGDGSSGSAVVPDRHLAVSDDPARLVRASAGECGTEQGALEHSSDHGLTWTDSDLTDLDLTAIRQLQFGPSGRVQMSHLDSLCSLQFARSYVYGTAWEAGPGAGGLWVLGGEDHEELRVAGSEVDTPCDVVDVAGLGERGIALCADATVSVSDDSGSTWSQSVPVEGASAVTLDDELFIIASSTAGDCQGTQVRTFDGEALGEPGECAEAQSEPGQTAIAAGGGELYVWAGDDIFHSADLGLTWE